MGIGTWYKRFIALLHVAILHQQWTFSKKNNFKNKEGNCMPSSRVIMFQVGYSGEVVAAPRPAPGIRQDSRNVRLLPSILQGRYVGRC